MHISLRCGEKIFINGAVVRVDRKVSIELLNDATYARSACDEVEDATTPLRQLYFIIQIMLMDPNDSAAARAMCDSAIRKTIMASDNAALASGLEAVQSLVDATRTFEALKAVRALFPLAAEILAAGRGPAPVQAA